MASRKRGTPLRREEIEAEACSPAIRLRILSELPFFEGLADHDLERINARLRDLGFQTGDTIAREGDQAERLYIVAVGTVRLSRYAEPGQSLLADVLGPGDFFGGMAGYGLSRNPDTATALTNACLISIGNDHFREIIVRHPSVALRTVELLSARLDTAREMLRQLMGFSAAQRLSFVLVRLAARLGEARDGETLIQTPLSREDLAAMAGTTTETASRVLSELSRRGIVRSGRGWVAIRDSDALSAEIPSYRGLD